MTQRQSLLLALWLIALGGVGQAQPIRDVFRRVNHAVVVVHAQRQATAAAPTQRPGAAGAPDAPAEADDTKSIGAGVLIAADGKVVTAAHVVQMADRVEVEFNDGYRSVARVISLAPAADVAMLQLTSVPRGAVVAKLGDADQTEVAEQVFAIGAPHGATHSLAVGYVSARRKPERIFEDLTALEVLQLDMAIFPGNSGGPVFNLAGEVIGIVSHVLARAEGGTGPGFAVTSNVVRRLMLEEKRVWIGIEVLLVEGPLALAFNVPQPAGLLVQSVASNSVGARLGLHEGTLRAQMQDLSLIIGGDIILELLGTAVRPDGAALVELQRRMDRLKPGDTLTAKVLRGGQVLELSTRIPAE